MANTSQLSGSGRPAKANPKYTAEYKAFLALPKDAVLSLQEQVLYMEEIRHQSKGDSCREDPRFPDVWVKVDGTVIPVKDMGLDHMCMTIGLWLRKEFERNERERLGLRDPKKDAIKTVSAYDGVDVWLTQSQSMRTVPSLATMLVRLRSMEGGMEKLHSVLAQRGPQGLQDVHEESSTFLFQSPAFF